MPQVYAARFEVRSKGVQSLASAFHDAVREWVGPRWPEALPWFGLQEVGSIKAPDGSIFRWEPFEDEAHLLFDFSWRHLDADDPGIQWSTQASLYGAPDRAQLNLVVTNTGPEGNHPDGRRTTRPRLLASVLARASLKLSGLKCQLEPTYLSSDNVTDFVRYTLYDRARVLPVIVLAPQADGTFILPPDAFAKEWLGLGEPIVLDSPAAAFRLTDELGSKELSCFHGGLRVYLPDLHSSPDPYRHPLLVARRVRIGAERLKLAQFLALLTTRRYEEEGALAQLRDERSVRLAERQRAVLGDLEVARKIATSDATWEAIAVELDRSNRSLQVRVDILEEQLGQAQGKVRALQYALAQRAGPSEAIDEAPVFLPASVREVVEFAQATLGDKLLILPQALEAAGGSPYSDLDGLYKTLRALAVLSGAMAAGPLGRSVRDACRDLELDYATGLAPATSKRLRDQFRFAFEGVEYVCEEHIRLGGSTYDPQRCARIYFTTSQLHRSRIVIGHVGRHLDVMSTT